MTSIPASQFGAPLPEGGTVGVMAPSGPYFNGNGNDNGMDRAMPPAGRPDPLQAPLGHDKRLASIPIGVQATLDSDAQTLTIDQPGVRVGPYR